MLEIAALTYSFALASLAGIAAAFVPLVLAFKNVPKDAVALRTIAFIVLIAIVILALRPILEIFKACHTLLYELGGSPGPFGLIGFPYLALFAIVPALIGALLIKCLAFFANKKG